MAGEGEKCFESVNGATVDCFSPFTGLNIAPPPSMQEQYQADGLGRFTHYGLVVHA